MYFMYTFCLFVGLLVSVPWYLIRSRRYIGHAEIAFRASWKFPNLQRSIWVHAVSVGEVQGRRKTARRTCACSIPDSRWCFPRSRRRDSNWRRNPPDSSTISSTFPFDFPGSIRRTLARVDPELVIIAETEIWPNFLRECRERSIPVMMVNGRISDRSFPRYRWIRRWLKTVLNDYAVLGMQSEMDRERIESLGADQAEGAGFRESQIRCVAARQPLDSDFDQLLKRSQPLWIAASTTAIRHREVPSNEEEQVLDGVLRHCDKSSPEPAAV